MQLRTRVELGPNALKSFEFIPLCFCVVVHLRTRKVSYLKACKALALRLETYLVERVTETQKYKGVIFEQFESVSAH